MFESRLDAFNYFLSQFGRSRYNSFTKKDPSRFKEKDVLSDAIKSFYRSFFKDYSYTGIYNTTTKTRFNDYNPTALVDINSFSGREDFKYFVKYKNENDEIKYFTIFDYMNEISYQNSYKISEGSFTKFLFNELSEVNKKFVYESLELTGFLFSLLINYKVYKKDYMGAVNLIYRVDKLVDKMLSTTEKEGSNGGEEPFYYIWPSFGTKHYHQLNKVSLSNNFIVSTVHSEKIVGCYLLYKDYNNSSKGAFNLYFFINKRASSVSSKSLIFEGLKLDKKYMNTIHNVIIEKLKQTNRVESQFIITSSSNLYKSCDNGLNMDIMECDSGILKHFLYNVAQPETICNIKYYDAEIFNEISNNQERFLNLVRTFLEYEFGKTLREKNIKLIYNALDTLIKKSNLNYTILDFCEGLPERISSLFLRVMIL